MVLILWLNDYEKFGSIKRALYTFLQQFQAPECVGTVTINKIKMCFEYPDYTNIVYILMDMFSNRAWFNKEQEHETFKNHVVKEYSDFGELIKAVRHLEL